MKFSLYLSRPSLYLSRLSLATETPWDFLHTVCLMSMGFISTHWSHLKVKLTTNLHHLKDNSRR